MALIKAPTDINNTEAWKKHFLASNENVSTAIAVNQANTNFYKVLSFTSVVIAIAGLALVAFRQLALPKLPAAILGICITYSTYKHQISCNLYDENIKLQQRITVLHSQFVAKSVAEGQERAKNDEDHLSFVAFAAELQKTLDVKGLLPEQVEKIWKTFSEMGTMRGLSKFNNLASTLWASLLADLQQQQTRISEAPIALLQKIQPIIRS